jgi:hypothetical protein
MIQMVLNRLALEYGGSYENLICTLHNGENRSKNNGDATGKSSGIFTQWLLFEQTFYAKHLSSSSLGFLKEVFKVFTVHIILLKTMTPLGRGQF